MQIKNVAIVGGGSSGWMAAAALSKTCPQLNVSLVESPDIKIIGVGESTLGHINRFLGILELKDEDWMSFCNATYKNSIRFTNFREEDGTSFHYPFIRGMDTVGKYKGIHTWGELATKYPDEFPPSAFAEMFAPANMSLVMNNKQHDNRDGALRSFSYREDTAYHMDATLFGIYLRDHVAIPNGVTHIKNEITDCVKDDKGNITSIICKDGQKLEADLWIDCTGFKSQLLEQWMGSKYISFDNILANDMAWAVQMGFNDRENEMVNYTDCTALKNGWVWKIPLWNRIGTGYVFSSKFISPEDAKIEFKEHLAKIHGQEKADAAEPRLVKIRHGKREKSWVQNVVGIGLSCGFVEPLESTGLLTTHENIIKLIDVLNRRDGYVSRMEKEMYNQASDMMVSGFAGFVASHYALSKRTDSPYWVWATQENDYQPNMMYDYKPKQDGYGDLARELAENRYMENQLGLSFILAGMGIKNVSTAKSIDVQNQYHNIDPSGLEHSRLDYHRYKDALNEYVKTLPSHYEFLRDRIYGGKDEYAK